MVAAVDITKKFWISFLRALAASVKIWGAVKTSQNLVLRPCGLIHVLDYSLYIVGIVVGCQGVP